MNIFQTHAQIVEDYANYISSFLNIADQDIKEHVESELKQGKLWPEPLLQFNPAFEMSGTAYELAESGVIHKELAAIFKGYSLYSHQVQAIQLGTQNQDFIVTSGTGSGKSLTYIGSIFHHLLCNPSQSGIVAIVVYPMNALINSQYEEFDRYKTNYEITTGKEFPLTFGQYTGQEKEEKRQKMRENPPHILLTNYMMLELLLTRLRERSIRDAIYNNLRFLVFDELHTYRGRQGADVAMLIRRIRAKCLHEITSIGTSATMVSIGDSATQRTRVADVATLLFGRTFSSGQIINEKLTRSLSADAQIPTQGQLSTSILAGVDVKAPIDALKTNPVAIWLENRIALDTGDTELRRGKPQPVSKIVDTLSSDSGLDATTCRHFLIDLLQWISLVNQRLQEGGQHYTYLPFKLHQFISQTGSVYTTLDQDENRYITLEPGIYKKDEDQKKPIFPNVFSRASGHAFICVSRNGNQLEPREFRDKTEDEDSETTDGYLIIGEDLWNPLDDLEFLPDAWLVKSRRGPDSKKKPFFPVKLYFDEFGKCSETEPMKWWGWFMQAPLLFDPTAGAFYDTKTNEGTKLTKLGSEGRSTSTTITAFSILNQLREAGYQDQDQKLLSFTDNRQDAALQAGHFNDFVQVVRLRVSIYKALADAPSNTLNYTKLGEAIFNALGLPFTEYANRNDEPSFPNVKRQYEECLKAYLSYQAIADLRRSWRIVLPNLEQCGLLTIAYLDMDEVASTDAAWLDVPLLNELNALERKEFLTNILDFFRLEFAIHSENYLTQAKLKEHEKQFREMLKAPWTLDRSEELREPFHIRTATLSKTARISSKSIGPASSLGKFIKLYAKQRCPDLDLRGENYKTFITRLMAKLDDADYLRPQLARSDRNEDVKIYRLKIEKIVWVLGDGQTIKTDTVKRRSYKDQLAKPNEFFRDMYCQNFPQGNRLRGEDHTGQLSTETRIEREDLFRQGKISALFCSPTMELGIDIGGLSVVHMRNAPPNPANYAQRSGRAGRSGQGALIFTYCSSYSPHDRHYFQQQSDLVAGAIQAPRLDLCNKELLLTHLNALAISEIGLPGLEEMGGARPSMMGFVEDDNDKMPLSPAVINGLKIPASLFQDIKASFTRVTRDFSSDLERGASSWYGDQWIDQTLGKLADNLDQSLNRWRRLYRSARTILTRATQKIDSGTLSLNSDEYKKHKRNLDQATRQLDLLRNNLGGRSAELSEFYPYRYLASEGFLPGYNFTRLPLRIFLPTNNSSGEFISRPRAIALREFGPLNVIYHNGRKYRVSQLIVQDADSALSEAKVCKKSGYFLTGDQKDLEICPFSGENLGDNANCLHLSYLLEMSESRAEERDRISCEEEERVSMGFRVQTYISVDGGNQDRVRKAVIKTSGQGLLNLRYIPAARLVHVNHQWRAQQTDGFPVGMISGDWASSMPEAEASLREEYKRVKLWTSTLADALYIEPTQPLGLKSEGVITLQYALKHAIENVFQVESNEIGVISIGESASPNILLYEAAEGSLGILSQFVENIDIFHQVIEQAIGICRFDDESYKGPASYDDLLSYYNQRDHKLIDRHLIADALNKLRICTIEIQTNKGFNDYDGQYQTLIKHIDPSSSMESKFIDYLYTNGLRLPDAAQKRVDGLYVQPDFYYHPRFWVFCDGSPHDDPAVKADDEAKRQAIIAMGDEVWVYYYKDNLANIIAARPDIFKRVR